LLFATLGAQAAVVSEVWREGRLTLTLDDGKAELEWLANAAIRFSRSWGGATLESAVIKHDPVLIARQDTGGRIRMRSRYLIVELDENVASLEVQADGKRVVTATVRDAVQPEVRFEPAGKVFGALTDEPKLNLGAERAARSGFFFTDRGYGVARFESRGAHSVQFALYYGPSPKEILEQHQTVTGVKEITDRSLGLLPVEALPDEAVPLPRSPVGSWDALARLVRVLNHWSLAGVQYPAFDLALLENAPDEVRQRALDLAAVLPVVYKSAGRSVVDRATRAAFLPYLTTYLREGFDRGFPVLRPLPLQFPLDAGSEDHLYEIMLGDEFLLAPVVAPGERRRLALPRGLWTDLRTNVEYRGNQTVEIDAPPGRVPMFARNGSVFPMATGGRMELHYIPSLAGEFFLWEPRLRAHSQFHAAPAGDYLRAEVESKAARTYEWVLHHTPQPREVAEETVAYRKAGSRAQLRAGAWWHDARLNNLHVMLRAEAGTGRILNVSFP
jgi:hypothetical protein